MFKHSEVPPKMLNLIKAFKIALKKYFKSYERKSSLKENDPNSFYQLAKKAETEERNLIKAMELYTRAIQNGEKKDSSIKDFASSLHQLGYTKEAVRLMDECEVYYDGNKEKYFRLRDNLQIQINPTGKHLCRYLLIENVSQQVLALQSEEDIKNSLFRCPKRIKKIDFLEDFELIRLDEPCLKQKAHNILVEFESFSAAKKTLESYIFEEWFGSNLYWVNYKTMRIICGAFDGKKDFEQGFLVTEDLIETYLFQGKQSFWTTFGEKIYSSKISNGFVNLLSTHLIKENQAESEELQRNKENIFERSKIHQPIQRQEGYFDNSLQNIDRKKNNYQYQKYGKTREKNRRQQNNYKSNWY